MQLSHTRPVVSAVFDEPNLVSSAGLVPVMALAWKARLCELADERLTVPTDKGANAGLKLSSLVAGMAAGADSIDDMALLRHGGVGRVFTGAYAPSTLGSFLRSFTFGHVRQVDAVAARFLTNLAEHTALLVVHFIQRESDAVAGINPEGGFATRERSVLADHDLLRRQWNCRDEERGEREKNETER